MDDPVRSQHVGIDDIGVLIEKHSAADINLNFLTLGCFDETVFQLSCFNKTGHDMVQQYIGVLGWLARLIARLKVREQMNKFIDPTPSCLSRIQHQSDITERIC